MSTTIFGYTWEQIQAAQQGGRLGSIVRHHAKPIATERDHALLRDRGLDWLYDHQMAGVLGRLGFPMERPENLTAVNEPNKGNTP